MNDDSSWTEPELRAKTIIVEESLREAKARPERLERDLATEVKKCDS